MTESIGRRALLNWGLCPQTPGIYRFRAGMAVLVRFTIEALERRIGLRRNATRAPTQAPEWQGRLRPPRISDSNMPAIDVSEPQVIASVRLFRSEDGGRPSAILAPHFTCPMEIAGELFTCRLYLTEVGRIDPGCEATVPIRFLAPELVSDKLEPGLSFKLWDGHYFAEGTVLTSNFRPADS